MCNEGLATTQCLICRRVGISAADRTRLTSGQPRSTTTTALSPGHVLELRYGCMRIPATSGRVHRSVVAGLRPRYHRCRPRPGCRYPNSWPSGDRGSRASRRDWARGTEYRASWTTTPTSRWGWWSAWRWATLGHSTEPGPIWESTHPTVPHRRDTTTITARPPGLPLVPNMYHRLVLSLKAPTVSQGRRQAGGERQAQPERVRVRPEAAGTVQIIEGDKSDDLYVVCS